MKLEREVRALAVPAIATSLLQTAVFLVDRAMLGRHGSTDLAAIHIAGNVEWSLFSIMSAFTIGTLSRVGMATGAGDRETARAATTLSLAVAVGLGLVLAAASVPLLALVPAAFPHASPAAIAGGTGYLRVTLAAAPAMLVAVTATAALQGSGDTRTPFVVGAAANLVHVAVNRVLILGAFGVPAMGAKGAGISTALTFVLEAILLALALARRDGKLSLRPLGWPTGALRELRSIGRIAGPAVLERSAMHTGFLLYTGIIGLLGDTAMAANQGLISVEAVCFLSADGFGVAAASLVAKKIGEGKPADARRAATVATRSAVLWLGALALAILALRWPLVSAFTTDRDVAALGVAVVPILSIAQPFMATGIVVSQAVRGAGATRVALVVSFLGSLVVRVGACWLLGVHLGFGLAGVWVGSTLDWAVRSVVLVALVATRGNRILDSAAARYSSERALASPAAAA